MHNKILYFAIFMLIIFTACYVTFFKNCEKGHFCAVYEKIISATRENGLLT